MGEGNDDLSCFLSDDMELVLKALLLADMIYMSDEEEEGEEEECPICTDPLHGDIHRWAWQEVKVTKIILTILNVAFSRILDFHSTREDWVSLFSIFVYI